MHFDGALFSITFLLVNSSCLVGLRAVKLNFQHVAFTQSGQVNSRICGHLVALLILQNADYNERKMLS